MTKNDLIFMLDDNKQKHYLTKLQTLIKECGLDPCKILRINTRERYYAEKIASGLCKITPTLANRINDAWRQVNIET